jgi:hemolysin activation/secretion protein
MMQDGYSEIWRYGLWVSLTGLGLVGVLLPGAIAQPLPNPNPIPSPAPQPEPELPSIPPPAELLAPPSPATLPPLPAEERLFVSEIEVQGSTLFTTADWQAELDPLLGRTVTYAELFALRDRVNQFYQEQGYLTTGAIVRIADSDTGRIVIQVIEGRVEAIEIQGNQRLAAGYVRRQLAAATQAPLNIPRLQAALQQLQIDPLIERIESELAPGTELGTNRLTVAIVEADSFDFTAHLDNNRAPSVGSLRRGLTLSEGNLTGWGDRAEVTYNNTDGSDSWDFSYTLPLDGRNSTIRLNHSTSDSAITEAPFSILDIEANATTNQLAWRTPLWRTLREEGAIGLTLTQQTSNSSLLDIPFPLSAGADADGRLSVTAVRFVQDWTRRSEQEIFAARSQFSLGVPWFNATTNETGPDTEFFTWRGQAQWIRQLAPQTLLVLRSDLQWSDRALVSFEKFSLGGQSTVRGYRQDVLLGDGGWFNSVEVRVPVWRDRSTNSLVQLVPFPGPQG